MDHDRRSAVLDLGKAFGIVCHASLRGADPSLRDGMRVLLKEVEDRARDRVSRARAATQRWVESAEQAAQGALDDALDICCGD